MIFRRFRSRLDSIQAEAEKTMKKAQDSMEKAAIEIRATRMVFQAFMEEVLDGFGVDVEPAEKAGPTRITFVFKEKEDLEEGK